MISVTLKSSNRRNLEKSAGFKIWRVVQRSSKIEAGEYGGRYKRHKQNEDCNEIVIKINSSANGPFQQHRTSKQTMNIKQFHLHVYL